MLPFFPLNLVVYPHEKLNLHIFEPRYRQLVQECLTENKTFGILPFINGHVQKYGTEMRIIELKTQYDDGRMDIKTQGLRIFKTVSFHNPVEEKLYAGGEVAWQKSEIVQDEISPELLRLLQKLKDMLQVQVNFEPVLGRAYSYQIAHQVGFSLEQELALLKINSEAARQEILIEHIYRIIPILQEVERSKERIRQNGHFKNLDPLKF